jgi:hypothetical protein
MSAWSKGAVCAAANMRMQAAAPSCSQRRATRCSDGKVRHGRLRASEDGERPGVLVREGGLSVCGKREERDERDGPLVCGVAVLGDSGVGRHGEGAPCWCDM